MMNDRLQPQRTPSFSSREMTFEAYVDALLADADRRQRSPFVISTVGGGGKTTTLFELFLRYERERSVILTTTTAMIAPAFCGAEFARVAGGEALPDALKHIALDDPPQTSGVWYQHPFQNIPGKYKGIAKDVLDAHVRARRMANDILYIDRAPASFNGQPLSPGRRTLFLCEADGSKRKPLKGHAAHEPVIPASSDLTLILFGLSGIGKPCTEEVVHRAEVFAGAAAIKEGDVIAMDHLLRALKSRMFFKGVPPTARVAVIFHQTDALPQDMRSQKQLREWAEEALSVPGVDAVFFRGANPEKPGRLSTAFSVVRNRPATPLFSTLLLAAGTSSRMEGQNKLLRPLGPHPIIAHTLRRVFNGPCRDIIITTGHDDVAVREALKPVIQADCPPYTHVTVVRNPHYLDGQGTSVACAAAHLNPASAGCYCVPGDQPFLSPGAMRTLAEESSRDAILVPCREDGSRASPAYFGSDYFDELTQLRGDVGGRQVMARHPDKLQLVPTGGSDLFYQDVDTNERFEKLRRAIGW